MRKGSAPVITRARGRLVQSCEDRIEIAFGARIQDMELQPKGTCRRLHNPQLGLGLGIGSIDEHRNSARPGYQLARQLQPLRRYLDAQCGHTCDVAAWSVEAGDDA